MPVLDLGKVVGDPGASMRYRGAWNSGSEYFNNASYIDAVTHNGSLWICKVTNTNQVPAIGTYWGIGAQGMAEDNMVFSAYSAFPSVGDENKLYIDNTVNPALMYIWDGSAYVPAGGGGEVAAEDVTYDNASSSLAAQTVQEALDEIAEAENVIKLNQADAYNPDSTYAAGAYCIYDNVLYKSNQAISVAEAWTPAHWTQTTVAAELSGLNSSITVKEFSVSKKVAANEQAYVTFNGDIIPDGYSVIAARCSSAHAETLCGCPIVEKTTAYVPYLSRSAFESEQFKLYVTLQRIS